MFVYLFDLYIIVVVLVITTIVYYHFRTRIIISYNYGFILFRNLLCVSSRTGRGSYCPSCQHFKHVDDIFREYGVTVNICKDGIDGTLCSRFCFKEQYFKELDFILFENLNKIQSNEFVNYRAIVIHCH